MEAESWAAYGLRSMPFRNSRLLQCVRSWPRRVVIITVIAVLLLGARIAMPYVVKRMVNDRLQRIPAYTGYVNDIGIHLWRGAFRPERAWTETKWQKTSRTNIPEKRAQ